MAQWLGDCMHQILGSIPSNAHAQMIKDQCLLVLDGIQPGNSSSPYWNHR